MRAAPRESTGSDTPARSDLQRFLLRYGRILLPVSALFWYSTLGAMLAGPYSRVDFNCMYLWGLAARSGINPYIVNLQPLADAFHLATGGMNFADYPPLFVIAFEPLSYLSPNHAYIVWSIINVLAVLVTISLLLSARSGIAPTIRLFLAGLALFYFPLTYHFYWAQVQIIMLLLVTLANEYLERKREAAAGVIIALAGLIKIFPFYLLSYLILTRRWRALYYSSVTIFAGSLIAIMLLGLAPTLDFLVRLLNRIEGNWLAEHKFSEGPNLIALGPVTLRVLSELIGSRAFDRKILSLVTLIPQLFIVGLSCYSTLIMVDRPERQEWLLALWTAAIVAISPTSWIHYMVVLMFPYLCVAKAAVVGRAALPTVTLGLVSYLLTQAWPLSYAVIALVTPLKVGHLLIQNWFCLMTLLAYLSIFFLTIQPVE